MVLLSTVKKAQEPKALTYSQFLTMAEKGGELLNADVLVKNDGIGCVRGKTKDAKDYEIMAPFNDPELFTRLHAAGVEMTVKPPRPPWARC